MRSRGNQNQNLIPRNLMLGRIRQLCMPKVLGIVAFTAVVVVGYKYGMEFLDKTFKEQEEIAKKNSTQGQLEQAQKEKSDIQTVLQDIQSQIENLNFQINNWGKNDGTQQVSATYTVTNFILDNRPKDVTFMMLEDKNTYTKYSLSGGREFINNTQDAVYGDNYDTSTESSTPSTGILLHPTSGASNILILHGYTPNRKSLSEFSAKLGDCEDIVNHKILAVEEVKLESDSISVFEIEIEV